jgi:predicted naringenin-chalcone synthase
LHYLHQSLGLTSTTIAADTHNGTVAAVRAVAQVEEDVAAAADAPTLIIVVGLCGLNLPACDGPGLVFSAKSLLLRHDEGGVKQEKCNFWWCENCGFGVPF